MTDDTDPTGSLTPAALQALGELLNLAARHGIGITLMPDAEGWAIGYIQGMGGGDLSSAYELETAVHAAKRPLIELADRSRRGD